MTESTATTTSKHGIRWGRWIGASLLFIVIGLVVAHGIWRSVSHNRLRAKLRELADADEPLVLTQLLPNGENGDDNGGNDVIAAASGLNDQSDSAREFDSVQDPAIPLTSHERKAISDALAEAAPQLQMLDSATTKPRLEWYFDPQTPAIDLALPRIKGLRGLANRLAAASLVDHESGKDDQALQRLQRVLTIARVADTHPSLVGHLVATGCQVLCAARASELAPDLRIGGGADAAPAAAVEDLIAALLDEHAPRAGYCHALRAERILQMRMLDAMFSGARPVRLYMLRAVIDANAVAMLDYTGGFVKVCDAQDLPAARAASPSLAQSPKGKSLLYMFAQIVTPAYDRAVEAQYRCMTDRRLAATALAIRWYAVEHDGHLPAKLEDLVPQYLPALPKDPMATNGRLLGYRSASSDPILYSVGTNGTDEAGSELPDPTRNARWTTEDRAIHLTRQPRRDAGEK
jgi:hypothetical protein